MASANPSGMRRVIVFAILSVSLAVALVVVDLAVLGFSGVARAFSPHYYLALGDSLSFGYQPNLDFSGGFVDDVYNVVLHRTGVTNLENLACAGETTTTMITGGCIARFLHKEFYTGSQLTAAVNFLTAASRRGRVSPVTLEIGANDVLKDWNATTCSAGPNTSTDLAAMDDNLVKTILPKLIRALTTPNGLVTGDLHMTNFYNPFAKQCPNSAPFVHEVNEHILADAAQFKIPVVDVYNVFGGDAKMADNVCEYTWMCSKYHDIHPTTKGYGYIAQAIEYAVGVPGVSPLPGVIVPAPVPNIGVPAGAPGPGGAQNLITPTPGPAPTDTPTGALAPPLTPPEAALQRPDR